MMTQTIRTLILMALAVTSLLLGTVNAQEHESLPRHDGVANPVYSSGAWTLSANRLTEFLSTKTLDQFTLPWGTTLATAGLSLRLGQNPSIDLHRLADSTIPAGIRSSRVAEHSLRIDGVVYGPWQAYFRDDGFQQFNIYESCQSARLDYACASEDVSALVEHLVAGNKVVWEFRFAGYPTVREEFSLIGLTDTLLALQRLEPR